jgi:hypothetical protein
LECLRHGGSLRSAILADRPSAAQAPKIPIYRARWNAENPRGLEFVARALFDVRLHELFGGLVCAGANRNGNDGAIPCFLATRGTTSGGRGKRDVADRVAKNLLARSLPRSVTRIDFHPISVSVIPIFSIFSN